MTDPKITFQITGEHTGVCLIDGRPMTAEEYKALSEEITRAIDNEIIEELMKAALEKPLED